MLCLKKHLWEGFCWWASFGIKAAFVAGFFLECVCVCVCVCVCKCVCVCTPSRRAAAFSRRVRLLQLPPLAFSFAPLTSIASCPLVQHYCNQLYNTLCKDPACVFVFVIVSVFVSKTVVVQGGDLLWILYCWRRKLWCRAGQPPLSSSSSFTLLYLRCLIITNISGTKVFALWKRAKAIWCGCTGPSASKNHIIISIKITISSATMIIIMTIRV